MVTRKWLVLGVVLLGGLASGWLLQRVAAETPGQAKPVPRPATVLDFGAAGDGQADDTAAVQRAVDAGVGQVRFPAGTYRLTKTVVIDLDRVGYTAVSGNGVAQIIMAGQGPAFRFVGTHGGTASPTTVKPNVWQRQRAPSVEGIEIVGDHPEALGVEATGTMQLTLSRLVVRDALHAVRLVERNRNVILSECHLYDNHGVGVYLDGVNLHQINVANCHISYNDGGGIVARDSELRNLHVGTCDIEANMGGPDSQPTANILLDSTGNSIAEVAIVGCTIQHAHDAPNSANIRIDGRSRKRPHTEELRHGNITIADNVLSDVQVNVEVRNVRGATITGNTFWQAYSDNLVVEGSDNIVVASNVFDRNPRYHGGDGGTARLGIVFRDCDGGTLAGNHVAGTGDVPAAIVLRRCRRMNVTGCTILDYGRCGLLLDNVSDSRVSDCLIRATGDAGPALQIAAGTGNLVVDNLLGNKPKLGDDVGVVRDNVYP
ncbi:MAG: hypothetical protein DWQ37_14450 [Planctomycetota bacterium]|mgnify:CR=1 FL=1|nr:MAG: hypothetical protein DWQ37_14450 [Planctomycetota bacterium]